MIVGDAREKNTLVDWGLLKFLENPIMRWDNALMRFMIWYYDTNRELLCIIFSALPIIVFVDVYFMIGLMPSEVVF